MKPWIEIDSRENNEKLKEHLARMCDEAGLELKVKSGGPADYIIHDERGGRWGIERKSFLDCYGSIIKKDDAGRSKDGRAYGELTQLVDEFRDRSILLLEAPSYFPARLKHARYRITQMVYTFFSERALVMVTMHTAGIEHTAYLIVKLAQEIHGMEFHGRGFSIRPVRSKPPKTR